MTREDAIKILKECRERKLKYTFYTLDEYQTATDMAIQALEQEPDAIHNEREQAYMKGYEDASKRYRTAQCEDAISRQAVIDAFWKLNVELRPNAIDAILNMVNDLPSVSTEKTGRWIPVSERLPDINDEVLVTYIVNGNTKKRYVETASYYAGLDEWTSYYDEYRVAGTKVEIVAWMPLPQPYKVESEDNECHIV